MSTSSDKKSSKQKSSSKRKNQQHVKLLTRKIKTHVDSNGGITNILLEELRQEWAPRLCLGIFPSDDLSVPSTIHRFSSLPSFSIIANLSPSNQPDGHFVALLAKPKFLIYIDSFGNPPSSQTSPHLFHFLSRIKELGREIFFSKNRIQGMLSPFCGLYALLFCSVFEKSITPIICFNNIRVSSLFSHKNDERCIQLLNKLL